MTLTAQQTKADKELFWLFEVELTYRIEGKSWTHVLVDYTNCWWMDHAAEGGPSRVFQMLRSTHHITDFGAARASIADCHANASSWFYDAGTGRLYVHMSGHDAPDTASKYYLRSHFWKYFSTHQYEDPNEIVFNGVWVEPRFGNVPAELTQEVNDFSRVGIKETWGSIQIANGDGKYDAALAAYIWHMCRFNLKVGARGDAYGDLVTVNRGRTGSVKWNDNHIELGLEDQLRAEDDY